MMSQKKKKDLCRIIKWLEEDPHPPEPDKSSLPNETLPETIPNQTFPSVIPNQTIANQTFPSVHDSIRSDNYEYGISDHQFTTNYDHQFVPNYEYGIPNQQHHTYQIPYHQPYHQTYHQPHPVYHQPHPYQTPYHQPSISFFTPPTQNVFYGDNGSHQQQQDFFYGDSRQLHTSGLNNNKN